MTQQEISDELSGHSLERELLALKRRREKILERGAEVKDGDKTQVNADIAEINKQIADVEAKIYERDNGCPIVFCEVTA